MRPVVYSARNLEEVEAIEEKAIRAVSNAQARWVRLGVAWDRWLFHVLGSLLFGKVPPPERVKFIAAYVPSHLGDRLMTVPAIAALRQAYPGAKIAVATSGPPAAIQELLSYQPLADDIVFLKENPVWRRGTLLEFDPALARLKWCDLFVNLHPSWDRGWAKSVLKKLLLARHIGAHSAVGLGVPTAARVGKPCRVPGLFVSNDPKRPQKVLEELGLAWPQAELSLPSSEDKASSIRRKIEALGKEGPLIILNPGAWLPANRWPAERFGEVGRELQKSHAARIVCVGTEGEAPICSQTLQGIQGLNLAGRTDVVELLELLRMANLCITNDTGTMHCASMVGCPTLALFATSKTPHMCFPLGRHVTVLLAYLKDYYDGRWQGPPHESLLAIQTEDVVRAAEAMLGQTQAAGRPKAERTHG